MNVTKTSISFYLYCLVALFSSCNNNNEQQALLKLKAAELAFQAGAFNEAKLGLDSMKILYPNAFQARKAGIKLLQQIDLREQEKTLTYLDSVLQFKRAAFQAIEKKFVLEKDTAYQRIGNYIHPSQTVEKNLHRTFLRSQVNEKGEMTLTSIYCGSSYIHHSAIKVTAPDGTYAETPFSKDSYETSDLGEKIEKADYRLGSDGNVIGFINLNSDKAIKIEYLGDRKQTVSMPIGDRKALTEVYELAQILSSIQQINRELEEANLKIGFIKRKIEETENDKTSSVTDR